MLKILTFIDDLFLTRARGKAERGDADAQYSLGRTYSESSTNAQDDAIAEKWFHCAAKQGHIGAQYALGRIYAEHDNMRGVPKNHNEAMKWYYRAADQGHIVAQYELGRLYADGRLSALSVPQDYEEAAKWYRRAAERGQIDAQLSLGRLYDEGSGVPQNNKEAYIWFSLVASSSKYKIIIETAVYKRDRVAAELSPADLATAQQEVQQRRSEIQARRSENQ